MLDIPVLLTLANIHPVFFIKAARYVVFPPGALAMSTLRSKVSICRPEEAQIQKIDGVLRAEQTEGRE